MGKQWKECQTLFWGAPESLQMVIAAMKLKLPALLANAWSPHVIIPLNFHMSNPCLKENVA